MALTDLVLDHLERCNGGATAPVGTLLYVGAGDGTTLNPRHRGWLGLQRAVLVDGDAETASELERRVAGVAHASVQALALAPAAGPLPWPRYNLPPFNGTTDTAPLRPYYPRLRLVEQRSVQAIDFATWLTATLADAGRAMLVLDVPGQEDALLATVPADQLAAFEAVVLRGCRDADAAAAPRRLQQQCFRVEHVDDATEPLWPVTLLRFDAQQHQIARSERELALAQAALSDRDARIAELTQAATQAQADARGAERRTREHLQQVQQLTRAGASDTALIAERDAQLAELTARCRKFESRVRDLTAELTAARSRHADEMDAARQANDARTAELERQLAAVQDMPLPDDHDDGTDAARQAAEDLVAQVRRLESERRHQAAQQQLLQDELLKAEGQIELIRGLLLGESGV